MCRITTYKQKAFFCMNNNNKNFIIIVNLYLQYNQIIIPCLMKAL